jgi:hypothetical protein
MPVTLQAANEATDTREESAAPVVSAPPRGTMPRRDRRRRVADLLTRVRWASYRDSLFERPDLIEDDYYRLLNQPRG